MEGGLHAVVDNASVARMDQWETPTPYTCLHFPPQRPLKGFQLPGASSPCLFSCHLMSHALGLLVCRRNSLPPLVLGVGDALAGHWQMGGGLVYCSRSLKRRNGLPGCFQPLKRCLPVWWVMVQHGVRRGVASSDQNPTLLPSDPDPRHSV